MLPLAIAGLLALVVMSWAISRDLIAPPVLYSGIWFLTLSAAFISGDLFYPVSAHASVIYLTGATAFCAGGFLSQWAQSGAGRNGQPWSSNDARRYRRLTLDVLLLIVALGIPVYWRAVLASTVGDVGNMALGVLLNSIRSASVEATGQGEGVGPLANVVVLSQFVAAAMFLERDGTRSRAWRAAVAILVALVLGGMEGTKGNAVRLVLTLFFLAWLATGRLRVAWVIWAVSLVLALFSIGLVLVNFAGGPGDSGQLLAETVLNYWIGSSIAFGAIAENPDVMESNQHIGRFFAETARSLGFWAEVPALHSPYTMISPTADSNTYTIYFSYFKDFGWSGTVLAMLSLGFALTLLHRRARCGGTMAKQLYAMMCVGVILSVFAEQFLLGLNQFIKAFLFFGFIYWFLPGLERMRATMSTSHA